MNKTALITGITGQDGTYLSQFLLEKNYHVVGTLRSYTRSSLSRLDYLGIKDSIELIECDLSDHSQVRDVIEKHKPLEIYNLAAQSSVSLSFKQPIGTMQFNIISVLNLLESIRRVNHSIKFYQASSSEMYGKAARLPITEEMAFHPLSPYAISKAASHWTSINYRESYGLFTCCGILFNHESFLRSHNFLTKKIFREAINIKYHNQPLIKVGNIDIKRDFGFAKEYVRAMWLMLQQEQPDDFIICSGKSICLREIIEHIFKRLSIPLNKIVVSEDLYRPTEIKDIYGCNKKAKQKLGWNYNLNFFKVLDIILEEELSHANLKII